MALSWLEDTLRSYARKDEGAHPLPGLEEYATRPVRDEPSAQPLPLPAVADGETVTTSEGSASRQEDSRIGGEMPEKRRRTDETTEIIWERSSTAEPTAEADEDHRAQFAADLAEALLADSSDSETSSYRSVSPSHSDALAE